MDVDTACLERRIRSQHEETLSRIDSCAADVVATWDGTGTTDSARVREGLKIALSNRGVLQALPGVLDTAIEVTGYELPATPVAAPPYVIVTSLGPILRGTVEDGRVVLTIPVFQVSTEDPRRYIRASQTQPLTVEWIETPSTADG